MKMKSIEDIWKELLPIRESIFKRIDEFHPLDLYIGCETTGERLLLFLSDVEPPMFPQGEAIKVTKLKRHDGKWSIILKLVSEELQNIFTHFCEDIIQSSRECIDSSVGGDFIYARYLRWKKLLETGFSAVLDESRLRGLIGELLFLDELLITYGEIESLRSWLGPLGADQDFRFSDRWFEVKTVRAGAQKIIISSVEQLEYSIYDGELIVIELDSTSANEPGSFTPIDLAQQIRQKLKNSYALELFNSILEGYGFFLIDEYNQYYFSLRQIRRFQVSNGFPTIRRNALDVGILNAKYEINLSSLASFEI